MFLNKLYPISGLGWTNTLSELERMRRQVDTLSEWMLRGAPSRLDSPPGVFPLINITEDLDNYYVRAELPGLKSDDLNIQVDHRNLTIAGERKIPSEGENARYHRRERVAGKFARAIGLPGDINADRVEAKTVDGLLTVKIPKSEAAKPRQIAVK